MDKRTPRILVLATFPPPIHGAAMVSQQIKDSETINNTFNCDYINIGTSRNIQEINKVGFLLTCKKLYHFLSALLQTLYCLLVHKYSICYCAITCYGKGFLKDAPFVILCKLFGRQIVIHQHNQGMTNYVNKPIYHWLLSLVYHNAKVILLSRHLYSDISSIVSEKDVIICPNGIPETTHIKAERKNNNFPRLLFLSNLIESKGVFILLDALKSLKEQGEEFECHFVGGESKEIDANKFANEVNKRNLADIVIYQGKKYGIDKDKTYLETDIFVFPTFNECFPLVLLEAMQHGLPCISTTEGGITDIIEDNISGYVVERKNVKELANKIQILLHNRELRQTMGTNGYNIYNMKFTLACFEKNFINAMRTAMK